MLNNSSFHSFALQHNAVITENASTPFTLYFFKQPNVIVHYIDTDTYVNRNIQPNFFIDWLNKNQNTTTKKIQLWEDVWLNKNYLVTNRLQSLLGKNKRIFARDTTVHRIDKSTADNFLTKHHLQGTTSAYYKFGLIHQNKIVAVATFSKARTMYDGPVYYRSYELERFATCSVINVIGGLSKLMKIFIETTQAKHIMTYIDRDWSSGEGFKKIGFVETETTLPQLFWINKNTHQRCFAKEITHPGSAHVAVYNSGSLKMVFDNRK